MKAAFAIWENRIAPFFDTARRIHVIEVVDGRIVREAEATLPEGLPTHKVAALQEYDVECLVCGAISRPMQALVASCNIQVSGFIAGDLREVTRAWLTGTLDRRTFGMPGCCGRARVGRSRWRGAPGVCLCPNCGHREEHECGGPCSNRHCPRCHAAMVRA
jgi:predicted Fe-Mo cluster-binding NifX family protein